MGMNMPYMVIKPILVNKCFYLVSC